MMRRIFPKKGPAFLLLRKRMLAVPLALACICALCAVVSLPSYVAASASDRQLPIYCVRKDYKVCSLTFDAAWGNVSLRSLCPQDLSVS